MTLSAFTVLSILLILWARLGFTLDVNRFFAAPAHIPSVLSVQCGPTQNVLTWTLPDGHNSNSVLRNLDGANGVWVCGGPSNIAPCTNLNVTTYTDTNVQAGHTYAYRHKAWADVASNTVTCTTTPLPTATPPPTVTATVSATPIVTPTPDPLAPSPGVLVGSCIGGATPSIVIKYSKLPPPAGEQVVNSNGMNKMTTPIGGQSATVQLNPYTPVDKGQYWEFHDTNVVSGYSYQYWAKYTPTVGTNTYSIVTSAQNCGLVTPSLTPSPSVSATPAVTPTLTPAPVPREALEVSMSGKNASTAGAITSPVQIRTGQQAEIIVRVRNSSLEAGLTGVITKVLLPEGLIYVSGSTTVGGVASTINSIAAGGLELGAVGPGQEIVITLRATANAVQFAIGITSLQVVSQVLASGAPAVSAALTIAVTKAETGSATTTQTGPGDALLAAFLISSIITLLYVSYTHTSTYKRREVGSISEQRDPLDFRS